jgi:hypothetical protein
MPDGQTATSGPSIVAHDNAAQTSTRSKARSKLKDDQLPLPRTTPKMSATIGIITDTAGRKLQKSLSLSGGSVGDLVKKPAPTPYQGTFTNVDAYLAASLAALIIGLTPNQALCLGSSDRPIGEVIELRTRAEVSETPGAIARSKGYLKWPDGCHWLLLDIDPEPGTPRLTAAEHWALACQLFPELKSCAHVIAHSTSSHVWTCMGEPSELVGDGNFHIYVRVRGDVNAFALHFKRIAWLLGKAFYKLAKPNAQTGVASVLERCCFDVTVWSPERVIYESGGDLSPFLEQRRPPAVGYEGATWNLNAIVPLTPEQITEADRLRDAAKATIKVTQLEVVVKHLTDSESMPLAQAKTEATRRVDAAERAELDPDHLVTVEGMGVIRAGDLGPEHHNLRCLEPQEPGYRGGGYGRATIFHNTGRLVIKSHAHGGCNYRLAPPASSLPSVDLETLTYVTEKGERKFVAPSKIARACASAWRESLGFNMETESFWQYGADANGLWTEQKATLIRETIGNALERTGVGFSAHMISGIISLLESMLVVRKWREKKGVTPMRNGVLDNVTLDLLPHSPTNYLRWQLPYDYNPLAACDPIREWLEFTQDWDADRVQLLRAYLRAIVMGRSDLQRFLEVVSTVGGSGKSTFCNLAIALVGIENVHITDSGRLEQSRFETSNFKGKRLLD